MKTKKQINESKENTIKYVKQLMTNIENNPSLMMDKDVRESLRSQASIVFTLEWILDSSDRTLDKFIEEEAEDIQGNMLRGDN